MTRFLLVATLILVAVAIPVSTIYWWPQFWGPQAGYWDQWVPWLKIVSAILGALWLLRLIMWIKEKREESKSHRDMGISMNVSPPLGVTPTPKDKGVPNGKRWYVKPDGTTTDTPPYNASEPISYIVSEPLMSQSGFQQGQDFLSKYKYHENEHAKGETDSTKEGRMKNYENDARVFLMKQEVSRLVEEGRLTPNEAIKLRQDIENSIDSPETYLDAKRFLQAIRHRPSK